MRSDWSFLTNQARVLLCIAHDPGIRLRELAATLGITERSAYSIVNDLAAGGYVVKDRDGRRNRYRVQHDVPLHEPVVRERTVGELLELLVETRPRVPRRTRSRAGTVTPTRDLDTRRHTKHTKHTKHTMNGRVMKERCYCIPGGKVWHSTSRCSQCPR